MYKEYKIEYTVFRNGVDEYQAKEIMLKENSTDEAIRTLIQIGYLKKDENVSILRIIPTQGQNLVEEENTEEYQGIFEPIMTDEEGRRFSSPFFAILYQIHKIFFKGFRKYISWFVIIIAVLNIWGQIGSVSSTKDIKGTTWQYYGSDLWYKLQINQDGTYDFWRSTPVQGRWENHERGRYNTYEDRDYRTGEKMIVIDLEQNYSGVTCLTITNGVPSFRAYKYEEGVRVQQTSKNPWN